MENNNPGRKFIVLLILLLIVFAAIFLIAYVSLQKRETVFGIEGMPVEVEDWMIMILSLASMIKIVWELVRFRSKEKTSSVAR